MASSVSSVNTNSMNSIYGNRNVLSGLATGMDTESLIQNSVSGIKTKITTLQKQRTSIGWKQDAYRSIISKMVAFQNKYTSYSSSTNLLSPSFFDRSVITTSHGTNAGKISATGKSTSDIQINNVTQLASASRYTIDGSFLGSTSSDTPTISASGGVDLSKDMDLSQLSGSMTIQYGSKSVSIDFGELELFDGTDGKADLGKLKKAITEKLGEQKIVLSSGDSVKASDLIGVDVTNGKFTFTDLSKAGNSIYISDASKSIKETLKFETGGDKKPDGFTVDIESSLTRKEATAKYLDAKEMSFTLDGVTKKINFPTAEELDNYIASNSPAPTQVDATLALLQEKLTGVFGKGKITVGNKDTSGNTLQLSFSTNQGSSLKVSSPVSETLKLDENATSYLDTSTTLKDLKGQDKNPLLNDSMAVKDADGKIKTNADGKTLYSFQLNGEEIGQYTEDTAVETILADIRNNTKAGTSVSFSQTTGQFVFSAKETGVAGKMDFGGGLAQAMFGLGSSPATTPPSGGTTPSIPSGTFEDGKDAKFSVTINGGKEMELVRSTNTVNLDGLSVTFNSTFAPAAGADDAAKKEAAVTFTTKSDVDKISTAIKDMVKDYNEMVTEIKKQYSTIPLQKSNGKKYEPLTDEDKASMSESAIKDYEASAKEGLLFADQDLSSLYEKLRSSIASSGTDGSILRGIGLSTDYSQGLTTLSLDEDKLRSALESNPDQVKNAFTKVQGTGGSGTNGLMQALKTNIDKYSNITGSVKGILVQKAGTPLSSLSLLKNSLQDNITSIDKQIDRWTTKLSDQVDYYTSKFTQLEQLVSQMNSQSSALSGMLGG